MRRSPSLFFEDFLPGDVTVHPAVEVSAEDIVAFAREWDPQPMHLTEEGGKASILGGLSASGWHTCCLLVRVICEEFLLDAAGMGGPGIEEARWLRPVRPGDRLTTKQTVLSARILKSRPGIGLVKLRYEVSNQSGEPVMTMIFPIMFARRDAA